VDELIRIGALDEFPPGRGRRVEVGRLRLAVFNVGGRLHVLQDACPHMGASLADGRVEGDAVTCHWHGWRFVLETGEGRPPARSWACARRYDVELRGRDVLVRLPDSPGGPPAERPDDWIPWDDGFLKGG
jgi:nitrite reductase (NADH) small subunit/3-phenylpropionate/trans-cinnamate dioxygenase ferredoxin subunit